MRTFLTTAMLVAFATTAHATETEKAGDREAPLAPKVVAEQVRTAPAAAPILQQVVVEQRATEATSEAAVRQPNRNWWWTVAAIVVAGVILAVLL